MSDWIALDPSTLQIAHRQKGEFAGVEITIGVSPYDIPQKMRGRTKGGEFVIQFQYLTHTDEPWKKISQQGPVSPVIGVHTGRLYELRMKLSDVETGSDALPKSVQRSVSDLTSDGQFQNRMRNYELANEAVSDNAIRLLAR